MAWTPHFTLIGRDGVNIKDAWNPEPKCYLGLAAPGFPNYFVMNGPRGNLANGTVLPCLETEIDYVIKAAKKMQSDRIKVLDVRESVVDQLDEYIDAWHQTSVFSGSCRSWYKNNSVDGKPRVWGGSVSCPPMGQNKIDTLMLTTISVGTFPKDHKDSQMGTLQYRILGRQSVGVPWKWPNQGRGRTQF